VDGGELRALYTDARALARGPVATRRHLCAGP